MPYNLRSLRYMWIVICFIPLSAWSLQGVTDIKAEQRLNEVSIAVKLDHLSLADALELVADRSGFSIIVDGEPIPRALNTEVNGSCRAVLTRLADLYDYRWRLSADGVILMTKRFKDTDERPQANARELAHMAEEIGRALQGVSYDRKVGVAQMLTALGESLDPSQLDMLRRGLRIGLENLQVAQAGLVRRTIVTLTASETYAAWERLGPRLRGLPKSAIRCESREVTSPLNGAKIQYSILLHVPGFPGAYPTLLTSAGPRFEAPGSPTGPTEAVMLTPADETTTDGHGQPNYYATCSCGGEPDAPNQRSPSDEERALAKKVTAKVGLMTLGDVASMVREQAAAKVAVEEWLSDRKMILCASEVPARKLLQAIAELEDLTLTRGIDGTYLLTRLTWRRPRSLQEIPAVIQRILPVDIRGFLKIGASREQDLPSQTVGQAPSKQPSDQPEIQVRRKLWEALLSEEDRFKDALAKPPRPGDRLSWSDLGGSQQDRVVLLLLLNALKESDWNLMAGELRAYARDDARIEIELTRTGSLTIRGETRVENVRRVGAFGVHVPALAPQPR